MSSDGIDDEQVIAPSITDPTERANSLTTGVTRGTINDISDVRESLYTSQYGYERNLFDALGYVKDPDYPHFRARYNRSNLASALIDRVPKKAWDKPIVTDTGASEGDSEFEKVVEKFLSGDYTKEDPIEVFTRASRMERLGQFSLIFLGLADDNVLGDDADATDLGNEVDASSLADKDPDEAIEYLKPYDQGRVDPDEIDWITDDPTNPRYGHPKSYNVELGGHKETVDIHWERVIHVVTNKFGDEFRSPSVLRQALNRIDDAEKILGASSEGYWRSGYGGFTVSPPKSNGRYMDYSDEGENLHKQITRYLQNVSREIFTEAEIEPIDTSVDSPVDHLDAIYKDVSAGYSYPQSILMGNETGERATGEDRKMWHEKLNSYRDRISGALLVPLIQRLIDLNVFPEPQGDFRIHWTPLDEMNQSDEANLAKSLATAINTATGGKPLQAMTVEEFRQEILGWKPERGAEAQDSPMLNPTESLDVDEDAQRVQEQFSRINATVTMSGEIPENILERDLDEEDFIPPESGQEKAQRILDIREDESKDVNGGTDTGWDRAKQIAEGIPIPPDEVIQISNWFARHPKSEASDAPGDKPWEDNGWTARMLWGWDSTKEWSDDLKKKIEEVRESEEERQNARRYEEGDKVRTPDGRGFVVEALTEGFDVEEVTVEASEDSPTYVVVVEDEDKAVGYYKVSEISAEEWDTGIDNPEEDLRENSNGRQNLRQRLVNVVDALAGRQNVRGDGRFTYPESWRESDKPARLIAMDAWLSMGSSGVSSCISEMKGEVTDPAQFCADWADRLYNWDYWRGDSWAPGD